MFISIGLLSGFRRAHFLIAFLRESTLEVNVLKLQSLLLSHLFVYLAEHKLVD